jgi:hypothetical protein
MRLRIILIVLVVATRSFCHAQSDSVKVWVNVTNKTENDDWFDKLVSLVKEKQFEFIKQRLLTDTLAFDSTLQSHFQGQKFQIQHHCRPFIRINDRDVFVDSPAQTIGLVALLEKNNFNSIQIIDPKTGKEKFGKWGLCGMLLLTTKDAEVIQRIKKLGL